MLADKLDAPTVLQVWACPYARHTDKRLRTCRCCSNASVQLVLLLHFHSLAALIPEACDLHLARSAAGDWVEWLRLADVCGMLHLLRRAAQGVLSTTLQSGGDWVEMKKKVASLLKQCGGLKPETYQMMLHAVLHGVVESGTSTTVDGCLPSLSNWQPPPASPT